MPENGVRAAARALSLERTAVALSFWLGGVGLAGLKGIAYVATGSSLVRTSMFDSMGDVFSSAIMAVTQWQMNNTRDAHRYPVGKARFAPLGVLFFCAFMSSSMSSMAIDSLQTLFAPEEPDTARLAASAAVRRLLRDKRRLRWAYGPGDVEALASQYGELMSGAHHESEGDGVSTALFVICVGVKLILWIFCKFVARLQGSEIVKALGTDHLNDTLTNGVVVVTMELCSMLSRHGYGGPILSKADPAVSLCLSLYIVYGWVSNALEQVKVLCDRRAEADDFDVEVVRQVASDALRGVPLELRAADAYHAGGGFRVRLDLRPASSSDNKSSGQEQLASHLSAVRSAVRAAGERAGGDVLAVETCLLSRSDGDAFSWVKEYQKP